MLLIRPARLDDLEPLLQLATQAGFGLTTLPQDPALLRKRIVRSLRSFEDSVDQPGGEYYLLVLEDTETRQPVGTCGMAAKVGGFEPSYDYRIETAVHASPTLGVRKEIPVLHLLAEHSGPSEIGSLFLSKPYRRDGNGRFLSLSRFLFMAEHASSFDPTVIAEIRGVVDADGRSPFWDALGKHFFDVEFPLADRLSASNKRFIAELMPKHPIYVFLLPEAARQVIGVPHADSQPAVALLQGEGFEFANMVDIFDAGPVVSCALQQIRTVRESRRVRVAGISQEAAAGPEVLLANIKRDFRACRGAIKLEQAGGATIDAASAAALGVVVGDMIRWAPMRDAGARPARTLDSSPTAAEGTR